MLLIHAERPHAVDRISAGQRRVLVLELWTLPESGAYDYRPNVDLYMDEEERREEVKENVHRHDQ
jgi:hypothetical protein